MKITSFQQILFSDVLNNTDTRIASIFSSSHSVLGVLSVTHNKSCYYQPVFIVFYDSPLAIISIFFLGDFMLDLFSSCTRTMSNLLMTLFTIQASNS